MIEKLRSRHGIDLPVEDWETTRGLAFVIGGMAFLFVILPVFGALVYALLNSPVGAGPVLGAIVLGFAGLAVALLVVGSVTSKNEPLNPNP